MIVVMVEFVQCWNCVGGCCERKAMALWGGLSIMEEVLGGEVVWKFICVKLWQYGRICIKFGCILNFQLVVAKIMQRLLKSI